MNVLRSALTGDGCGVGTGEGWGVGNVEGCRVGTVVLAAARVPAEAAATPTVTRADCMLSSDGLAV